MKMRLVDGFVADLSEDPDARFHPSIAAEFVAVPKSAPADLRPGYAYNGQVWTPPVEPMLVDSEPAPAAYRTVMTPIRFKAQFSVMAQVKIKRARSYKDGTDPDAASDERKAFARDALDILFGSLDDSRLTEVDVADPSVIGGIDFVHLLGILTSDEAAEIKRGVPIMPA